ncbi:hypothetical protein [Acidithiobacillus sp.]|uniref:hypothetical protein n=2 Tax=Acidithiobacillus sp. TaxID=1872118 RepID=UPI003564B781
MHYKNVNNQKLTIYKINLIKVMHGWKEVNFTRIERMMVIAITAIPAAVVIRQYFCGIKIAGVPFVVGHFRIAADALAVAYAAVNRGRACNA